MHNDSDSGVSSEPPAEIPQPPNGIVDRIKRALPHRFGERARLAQARIFEAFGSYRYSSPGLAGLDRKVLPFLPSTPGVFLEIGANDGFSQSNTYYLERVLGWHGILIEPVPSLYRACKRLRKGSTTYDRACVGPGGPASIEVVDVGLMSVALGLQQGEDEADRFRWGSGKTHVVKTATLSDLIDKSGYATIDFMSVDVEGAEREVLSGLDFSRHTPGYLLVETWHPDQIIEIVGDHMELASRPTHHDFLFKKVAK